MVEVVTLSIFRERRGREGRREGGREEEEEEEEEEGRCSGSFLSSLISFIHLNTPAHV